MSAGFALVSEATTFVIHLINVGITGSVADNQEPVQVFDERRRVTTNLQARLSGGMAHASSPHAVRCSLLRHTYNIVMPVWCGPEELAYLDDTPSILDNLKAGRSVGIGISP